MADAPPLRSSPLVARHPANPILTRHDVPYKATLVFNAGVARWEGRYVMVFRNDYGTWGEPRFQGTNLGVAFSDDGVHWTVEPQPCLELADEEIRRVYDPRLTVLDGRLYLCFAVDTRHGVRGGIATTSDLRRFDILSLSVPDNRNMVLFPRRIGETFVRLERPFPVYSRGGGELFDIWLSRSSDLRYWGDSRLVLGTEHVPWANAKIGPAAPPVPTERGWLTTFHAVDIDPQRGKNGWEPRWTKRYTAGIMLLDLDDPATVLGLAPQPLLVPEAPYETEGGFRNNVVFPCGMILEDDGEVKVYYGAADTVIALATAQADDLVGLCLGG
ncbi:MAG: glycoside hydrolase family 130 protein [Candidatus Brocadiia bacterium]